MIKLNKFLVMFSLLFVAFTSCKDNEKERETIEVETTDEDFNQRLSDARSNDDVVNAVESNPELSTFATAFNAWDVQDTVTATKGDIIVFAPTNLAFSKVRQNTEAGAMIAIDDEELISYHIIQADNDLAGLKEEIRNSNDTLSIASMQGEDIKLSLDENNSLVLTGATGDSARVTDSVKAGNGMVYIIDEVLLPRDTSREVIITDEG